MGAGAVVAAELLELLATLVRRRGVKATRDELERLAADWPAPIGDADVDAAVADGLGRTDGGG